MRDRTDTVQTRTISPRGPRAAITTKPTPMPGHLPVEHFDRLLNTRTTVDLAETHDGTFVTATGTITKLRYLDPSPLGRVMAVLTDDDGHSAFVSFGPAAVREIQPLLAERTRVTVAGVVTRRTPGLPAGIDGANARMASV